MKTIRATILAAIALGHSAVAFAGTDLVAQGLAASAQTTATAAQTAATAAQTPTATGSTLARTLSDRFADRINCKDFGAIGDDTADDTAALNACISAWKATQIVPGGYLQPYVPVTLLVPKGRYKITSGLNFTNVQSFSAKVVFDGAVIDCQYGGRTCVDFLGSVRFNVDGLHILQSSSTTMPATGVQLGRISAAVADQFEFKDLNIQGYFSQAPLYNLASETDTFYHPVLFNYSTSSTAHDVILDGCNYWGATSAFVTETLSVGACSSFDENTFIGGSLVMYPGAAGQSAVWEQATLRARFIGSWLSAPYGYGFTIFSPSTSVPTEELYADIHMEGNSQLADAFYIDAPASSQVNIFGLTYIEGTSRKTDAIFKLSPNVTAVHHATNFNISIASEGNAITFLSAADTAKWQEMVGTVNLSTVNITWNVPAGIFQGCYALVSTKACNTNGLTTLTGGLAVSGTVSGTGLSTYLAAPPAIGGTTPSTVELTNLYASNGRLLISSGAPSINSGFGTTPSIAVGSSGLAFDVNVGTGGTATSGTINMGATSTNGWNCHINDYTSPTLPIWTKVTGKTTTSITVSAYNASGSPAAWNSGDVLNFLCAAK